MKRIDANDWAGVAELMLQSAEKLAKAGADFLICPDNTIHQAFDLVEHRSPRPWLHIAREVAAEAKQRGHRRLAVLGTRYLMEGSVYREALKAAGIEHRVPAAEQRERINHIIFDGLVNGQFRPLSFPNGLRRVSSYRSHAPRTSFRLFAWLIFCLEKLMHNITGFA